jgi:hypothetical protein
VLDACVVAQGHVYVLYGNKFGRSGTFAWTRGVTPSRSPCYICQQLWKVEQNRGESSWSSVERMVWIIWLKWYIRDKNLIISIKFQNFYGCICIHSHWLHHCMLRHNSVCRLLHPSIAKLRSRAFHRWQAETCLWKMRAAAYEWKVHAQLGSTVRRHIVDLLVLYYKDTIFVPFYLSSASLFLN